MINRASRCFLNVPAGVLLLMVSFLFVLSQMGATEEIGPPVSKPITDTLSRDNLRVSEVLSQLPLSFEPATGSSGKNTKFISRQSGYGLAVSATEAVFALGTAERKSNNHDGSNGSSSQPSTVHRRSLPQEQLRFRLFGANSNATARGVDPLPERRNYFIGNEPRKWRADVPTFRAVRYEKIYPGIDLTYYGSQQQLEYDFEIAPHADPRTIRLAFDRQVMIQISDSGDLVLRTSAGEVRQQKPVVYQEIDGDRRLIEGRFVLLGKRQVGFDIAAYDRTKPLVIDPTLIFSTYFGGSRDDLGSSIAVDSSNNIYIAGTTSSANLPLSGAAFGANAGLADMFVTKIDATGTNVIYSTYVGGAGLDRADGMTIDNGGNAYVVGRVDSSSINFPTTPGAFAASYRGGDFDGVVLKLNAQGNALVYSTFLGGEENDSTEGIAVDSNGNAYVTGGTKSIGFPTTINAYQGTRAGDTDAFLTKINSTGSALLYSTYLGGSGTDRGSGVAIDSSGNAYIAGFTSAPDFPTTNAFQNSFGGSFDAFVAKIDTNATGVASLIFCTYLGGVSDDKAYGIAIDNTGSNIYVTGQTISNNFPVLNPAQPTIGGSFDAFVAKISGAGTKVYATYLGGAGDDRGTGIAVNSSSQVYVTGFTSSTNFPTILPLQAASGGGFDAFVTKLNISGAFILYSTYLGGSANESNVSSVTATNPIALDSSSNVYITGYTSSANFPLVLPAQSAPGGAQDAFITKISDFTTTFDYSVSVSPASRTVSPGGGTTFSITATPAGGFTGTINLSVSGLSNDATAGFSPPSIVISDVSATSATLTINTTAATPPGTYSLTINTTFGTLKHSALVQLVVSGTPRTDLALTNTASPNPATALANLTYRIAVTNNGPSPTTNVTITDTLPPGVNFISSTPNQGLCTGTMTVTCNLGSMSIGAQANVSIVILPQSPDLGGPAQLSNMASVTATENDLNPGNNSANLQTTVNPPSAAGPSMLDPNLSVKTVVTGLSQPTTMAFIGANDFLVLEKNTGKVQRVANGAVQSTVLDLAVNSASERGLLGIALHPNFALNGYVYLYWTQNSNPLVDSTNLADISLMSNRVDRFIWNGTTLAQDRNILTLRTLQADANQPLRGNHNGGILRFGPDGKLYILMGDNGRRGFLQNLPCGPTATCPGPTASDDNFGGPDPDNAHLTGFILRLNDDGSTPTDNPFYNVSTTLFGQAAANIKKIYAYGVRNGFGMGFDPLSGNLWDQENGDDAFDEMNRITPGANNGWIQMMGPNSRVAQFKQIETGYGSGDLQQLRWPPSLIADTPAAALSRLYMLPGAHYNDPEFSWKYAVAPAALGFVQGRGIGPQYEGDMFVGAAQTFLSGGYLFRFKLTNDRLHFLLNDPRLNDLVADNADKFDVTESESLLIGKDFGVTTDIETGPNGDLFVVSNTNGAVYEISGKQPTLFVANLNGAQPVPPSNSPATGTATILLNADQITAKVSGGFSGLVAQETSAGIYGPAAPGSNGPLLFPLPLGQFTDFTITLTPAQVQDLKNGLLYIELHNSSFTGQEIRGQFGTSGSASAFQFNTANLLVTEGGDALLTVTRLGDTSTAATVDYATSDTAGANKCNITNGKASSRCDYLPQAGTLRFAANETSKTIPIPIVDDSYAEGNESFIVTLSNSTGATLGSPSVATVNITDNETVNGTNPIDQTSFFVRQHYLDFLNREPDKSGFGFWTLEIDNCIQPTQYVEQRNTNASTARDGGDEVEFAPCNQKRADVSAAFFVSIEFQQTGYLVERLYKAAYGNASGGSTLGGVHQLPVPILRFNEFLPDTQQIGQGLIVGQTGWETVLENNKQSFIAEFVQRSRFTAAFPTSMTPTQFVDQLNTNAGRVLSSSERAALIGLFGSATDTSNITARVQAVRQVAENQNLYNAEFNRAFVLMQYFGYLRRNPNDLPDSDYTGYDFWLTKLNQFNGNFVNAEMVKAFITSTEYRQRFGP